MFYFHQELKIMGHPHMTCVAVGSADPSVSILAVADLMEKKGGAIKLSIVMETLRNGGG